MNMKLFKYSKLLPAAFLLMLNSYSVKSQTTIPDMKVRNLDNKLVELSEYSDNGKPTAIVFWATWCKPCIEELDNISFIYDDFVDEFDFNLVTICIDDSRSSASIKSFVSGKRWPFNVILDENQEIKRSMNVTDIPHYYIFNKSGELVKRHTGYIPGDEELMFDELARLSK